jgi:hypothetical protein
MAMLTDRKIVLEQLGELGGLGAGDAHDFVADLPVQGLGAIGAGRGEASENLRRVAEGEVGAAGVHALGRVGEEEVAAGDEARLLEHRGHALTRGAGVGRRLEDDELVTLHEVGEGPCR